ncbi:coiled-coil domain-containing protein 170-like isoform X4 [Monodelphis domestica]|uniref:coiled-coil domain-containing protein 170-like isoform X4 n=1 Tax=Monodelphis domestica TaxID=13616 RepID=UPI0024E1C0B4|nr:coiled-coil domain-containing protein 170-like isoform X4 [Monodelphis domestica]
MADPFQFLSQSDSGRSVASRSKGLQETMSSKVRHPSSYTSRKNNPGVGQATFDPPLEAVFSPDHMLSSKRGADQIHTDYAGLLVKNKTLQTEVRNLQNRILTKESSLQEMKFELENYKENNARQSSQILSLKDHIRDLEEINASATRIKTLKNASIQNLEKGNWDLSERVVELENRLRIQLVEREKAEQKAASLEKKLVDTTQKLASFMNLDMKGQDDPLQVLVMKDRDEANLAKSLERENLFLLERLRDGQKAWDKCQHDLIHKEKQISTIDQIPIALNWEAKTTQNQYQSFINQLAILLSNTNVNVPPTEDAVKERIQEISTNEQSWKYEYTQRENNELKTSQSEELEMKFRQLEKEKRENILWNIEQSLQIPTSLRLEEKVEKLQKDLSEMKLSNQNMKTQLTRVSDLKDKTIEKLQKSLKKAETIKEKSTKKVKNLKTTLDFTELEAKEDKEKAYQMLEAVTNELYTVKKTLEEVVKREKQLIEFRESVMKMMGFNIKIPDKDIINQLKPIIQAYEDSLTASSSRSKISSDCKTVQENE